MKKKCALLLILLPLVLFLSASCPLCAFADDNLGTAEIEKDLSDAIPDEFSSFFIKDGTPSLPSLSSFLKACFSLLKDELSKSKANLFLFLGCILLCSVFSLLQKSLSKKHEGPLRLCLTLCGCFALLAGFKGMVDSAQTHLQSLTRILAGFLPAITASSVAMGGVSSAAVSSAAFTLILSFLSSFSCSFLLPMQKAVFALDLCASVTGQKVLSVLSSALNRFFLFLLGLLSAIISAVFAFQHILSAKADSLAVRAVRFTAGSALPMVGSVCTETSRTLLTGLGCLKSTIGAIGVLLVLLNFLPALFMLLLTRAVFSFSSSFALALDVEPLDKLFKCGASSAGALCAIAAICDLLCMTALAVTIYTAV